MSIQGVAGLGNLLKKENTGKNILDRLSHAVRVTGEHNRTAEVAENTAETIGKKTDGFNIESVIMDYLDPTAGLSEEEKKAYEERIQQKLKSGKKLTSEEMNYLRVKNPQMYMQAARVQAMRENLEKQLQSCRSKEEVEKVYAGAVSMVGKEEPMKEAIIAAYDDAVKEFKKTDAYQALPATEEDAEQRWGKKSGEVTVSEKRIEMSIDAGESHGTLYEEK